MNAMGTRAAMLFVMGALAVAAPARAQFVIMQEATLAEASGGPTCSMLSMSADGARVLCDVSHYGPVAPFAARVFVRSGTTWSTEADLALTSVGSMLTALTMTADGTTAFLGQSGGTILVYTRAASTWSLSTTITVGTPSTTPAYGPRLLAASPDGTHLYVYSSQIASPFGTDSRMMVLSAGAWSAPLWIWQSNNERVTAAAFSRDGARFVMGVNTGAGGSDLRVLLPGNWMAEVRYGGTPGVESPGGSAAIADDGSRLLEGPSSFTGPSAVARVYHRSVIGWTSEAALTSLYAIDAVALSGDGSRAFILDRTASSTTQIDVWTRTGANWSADSVVQTPQSFRVLAADASGHRFVTGNQGAGTYVGAVYRVFDPIGSPCTDASTCQSGLSCVDGVCCNGACGGGVVDCQACAFAMTGQPDGVCSPLSAGLADSIVCHPSGGACENTQVCSPASTSCPTAAFLRGIECRGAADVCDVPEFCDGTSPSCPVDSFAPSASVCRLSMGDCDPPTHCTGTSAACPAHAFAPGSTICRPYAGLCDVAEHCTGTTADCPVDALAAAGTVCNPVTSGVCDAPDVCNGMTANCPQTYLVGFVCRAAAGQCDVSEVCLGTGTNCPPDGVLASGVVCRASSDPSCDPPEHCDGTSAMCPPDGDNTCATRPDTGMIVDAGRADGAAVDAGATVDAGSAPVATAACGCRAGRTTEGPMGLLVALMALAVRKRRR
jgi:MYXO-CTERM domain-containing protein